jgi:DNA-binding Lrp family transcriptional regulator
MSVRSRKSQRVAGRFGHGEMDDTDRKLLILIGGNPRIHYRELAKRLGISRQAVHHRVHVLTRMGVIREARAGVSIAYLDAVPVAVSGRSETLSIEKTLDRLGESEFTRRVVVAGGNYLYVVGFLRRISELDGFAEFVTRVAEMPEPMVGIYCLDDGLMPNYPVDGSARRQTYRELSPLDFRIVASLKDDARKPIADIAASIGVSAKTVRRHLESMISEGSLELQLPVDMVSGGDLMLIMHVDLEDGADKRVVGRKLIDRNYFRDQYIRTHINHPGLLIWVFWSDDIKQVRRALKETGDDEDVRSVMLNFCYFERLYDTTWRDKLATANHEARRGRDPQPVQRKR